MLLYMENNKKNKFKKINTNNSSFFNEIGKIFGTDEKSLTSNGKVYPLTVAINMLITLVTTFIIVCSLNYFNLLDYNYTTAELFLTCIVFFTIWNCIAGYIENEKVHYISTNMSLVISIFLLPVITNGPEFLIKKLC